MPFVIALLFFPSSVLSLGTNKGVGELRLVRKEVNPDEPCWDGRTPLLYAAERGHEGVVKTLLERKEVNPDTPDSNDRTLLSYSVEYRREEMVKLLLREEKLAPTNQIIAAKHRSCSHLAKAIAGFPNGPSKTGLDPLVWLKVKSGLMVEITPTGWSGLADQTWSGLVKPGPPSNRICTTL